MLNRAHSSCYTTVLLLVLLCLAPSLAAVAQPPSPTPTPGKSEEASPRKSVLAQYLRQELEKISSGDSKTSGTLKASMPLVKPTPLNLPKTTPTPAPTPIFGIFPPLEITKTPVPTPTPVQIPTPAPIEMKYPEPLVTATPRLKKTPTPIPTPGRLIPRHDIKSLPPYGVGAKEKTPDIPPRVVPKEKENIAPVPTPSPYPTIKQTPTPTPRPTRQRTRKPKPTIALTPTPSFVNPARILPSSSATKTPVSTFQPAAKPTAKPTPITTPIAVQTKTPRPTPKPSPVPTAIQKPTPAPTPKPVVTPEPIVDPVDASFASLMTMARNGKRQEARQAMAELAGANPEHPRAAEIRFTAALFEDNAEKRLSAFRTVMFLHENSVWASRSAEELGAIYYSKTDYTTAIEMFQTRIKSLDKKVNPSPLRVRVAACYLAMGEYKKALSTAKKVDAKASSETRSRALAIRGECLLALGKHKDTVTLLQTLIREHASFADKARAMLILGLCYEEMDQRPEAVETYRALLKTCPNAPFENKAAKERLSSLTRALF